MASLTALLASRYAYAYPAQNGASATPVTATAENLLEVKFDMGRQEIVFPETVPSSPVHAGDWVAIILTDQPPVHYRVENNSLFPTIKLNDVGVTGRNATSQPNQAGVAVVPATPATTPPPPILVPARMAKYDQMFDDMDDVGKAESIVSHSFTTVEQPAWIHIGY
jgi:ubiquitin-conjugating enzyme E2 Q